MVYPLNILCAFIAKHCKVQRRRSMCLDFSTKRWNKVRDNARKWWSGELGRPLIQVGLTGRDPVRKKSV